MGESIGAAAVEPGPMRRAGRDPDRLERARGLLRRMENRTGHAGARPAPGEDGLLPVSAVLSGLLPGGGLRRGSTVAVAGGPGAGSLLLALLAEASAGGSWAGVVGRPELGVVAAVEAGVRPERLALVPEPGAYLVAVTAALLDGLDLVAVAGAERAGVRAADRQRLAARARQRGAVLLALGSWPGADLRLHCTGARWEGPDAGAGRLRSRRVEVRAHGRGTGASGRSAELLLPGPDGVAVPAVPAVPGPGHSVPDRGLPDRGLPGRGLPDPGSPDSGLPGRGVPDPGLPGRAVPDRAVPDRGVPGPRRGAAAIRVAG